MRERRSYVQLLGLHRPETVPLVRNDPFKSAVNLPRNRLKQCVTPARSPEGAVRPIGSSS